MELPHTLDYSPTFEYNPTCWKFQYNPSEKLKLIGKIEKLGKFVNQTLIEPHPKTSFEKKNPGALIKCIR